MPVRPPDDAFVVPDFTAPMDMAEEMAKVPAGCEARGIFFQDAVAQAQRAGHRLSTAAPSYVAWKMYPVVELMRLTSEAARLIHPKETLREGMRRMGWGSYEVLLGSMAGRVVFGVLGKNIRAAFQVSPKAYEISLSGAVARVVDAGPSHTVVHVEGVHNCLDTFQVGALEGAITSLGHKGEVRLHAMGPGQAMFLCRWW